MSKKQERVSIRAQSFAPLEPVGDSPTLVPLVESLLRLTLDDVKPFKLNPRTTENPKFYEIAASVRGTGRLETTLAVTRWADDDTYVLARGGGTRYAVLCYLRDQAKAIERALQDDHASYLGNEALTDDDRDAFEGFRDGIFPYGSPAEASQHFHNLCNQSVLFMPAREETESSVLLGHLVENVARGDMTLVDQANGFLRFQEKFINEEIAKEAESGSYSSQWLDNNKQIPRKRAESLLKKMGARVSRRTLLRYERAATLAKYLPRNARHLNTDNVDKIFEMRANVQQVVDSAHIDHPDKSFNFTDEHFYAVLERYDSLADGGISVEELTKRITESLADVIPAGMAAHEVAVELAASKFRRKAQANNGAGEGDHRGEVGDSPTQGSKHATLAQGGDSVGESPTNDARPSLEAYRQKIHDAARRLAVSFDMEDCFAGFDGGLGYTMDLPAKPLNAELSSWIWWTLYSISEIGANVKRLEAVKHLEVARLLLERKTGAFSERVGRCDVPNMSHGYLANPMLPHDVFDTVVQVFRLAREAKTMWADETIW